MTGATFACFALGLCNALIVFLKRCWQRNCGKNCFAKFSGGNHDVNALGDGIVCLIFFCIHFSLSCLLMLLAMSYYAGFFFAVVVSKNMHGFALISVCENLLLNLCGTIAVTCFFVCLRLTFKFFFHGIVFLASDLVRFKSGPACAHEDQQNNAC